VADPQWLLSTIAQSTAALVAIVAGFLVSRVVSLASERQALQRRVDELVGRRSIDAAQLERLSGEINEYGYDLFLDWALDDYIEARGDYPIENALHEFWPKGIDEEVITAWAGSLNAQVRSCFGAVEAVMQPDEIELGSLDELARRGLDTSAYPEDMIEGVMEAIAAARRPRRSSSPWGGLLRQPASISTAAIQSLGDRRDQERQDERLGRHRDLSASIDALDAEITILRDQISRLSSPPEVSPGLVVLAGFAFVGIVIPLWMLGRRPIPHSPAARNLVIWLFAGGLAALLAYIFWAIQRLQRRDR
jgi:cell division protein FtsB